MSASRDVETLMFAVPPLNNKRMSWVSDIKEGFALLKKLPLVTQLFMFQHLILSLIFFISLFLLKRPFFNAHGLVLLSIVSAGMAALWVAGNWLVRTWNKMPEKGISFEYIGLTLKNTLFMMYLRGSFTIGYCTALVYILNRFVVVPDAFLISVGLGIVATVIESFFLDRTILEDPKTEIKVVGVERKPLKK